MRADEERAVSWSSSLNVVI